jgi:hypothetical protein
VIRCDPLWCHWQAWQPALRSCSQLPQHDGRKSLTPRPLAACRAGTHDTKNNSKKAGANGSILLKTQIVAEASEATDPEETCENGLPPVGSFDPNGPNGLITTRAYCCPGNTCVAKFTFPDTPGKTGVYPVCLEGTPADNELCRPENFGLLEVSRELVEVCTTGGGLVLKNASDPLDTNGPDHVTYGDCLATAAAAAVTVCSADQVNLLAGLNAPFIGRVQPTKADQGLLPSVDGFISDLKSLKLHAKIFTQIGFTDVRHLAAMVTGSHSLGAYRKQFSPELADCSFEPFDCTPNGYFVSDANKAAGRPYAAFDNGPFRVACQKQDRSLFPADCPFFNLCPDVTNVETVRASPLCPYEPEVAASFYRCEKGRSLAQQGTKLGVVDGIESDKFMCKVGCRAGALC